MLSEMPQVTVADGIAMVVLAGELDAADAAQLEQHLAAVAAVRPDQVIFDLRRVSYLDCQAAGVIIAAGRLPSGRRPVLTGVRPIVRRLLETSDLAGHCEIRSECAPPAGD